MQLNDRARHITRMGKWQLVVRWDRVVFTEDWLCQTCKSGGRSRLDAGTIWSVMVNASAGRSWVPIQR
jgi:hypothetical protein